MKKSLITLLSLVTLMSASFVSAETPTTATTESTTTQSSTKQVENAPLQPDETITDNGEQVETFPKDNMINDDINDNTETNDGQNWLDLPNSDDWRYNGFEGHKSLTPPTKQEQTTKQTEEVNEGQNWLELPNSDEWRYNGFEGHKSLTPITKQSTAEQAQTVPQPQPQQVTPQETTSEQTQTTTEQPQENAQVNNKPTAQQIENATKEPSIFVMDTLPQTGNKDILGDILEVLGFALLIGLAVYISYSPIKRKLNNNKKN